MVFWLDVKNSTEAFDEMLTLIREGEEVVWVRELGFGLNRGFSKTKIVSDIGSYERMCGVHLSLGRNMVCTQSLALSEAG